MGDLAVLPSDRGTFKAEVAKIYPDDKPGAVRNNAGQLNLSIDSDLLLVIWRSEEV